MKKSVRFSFCNKTVQTEHKTRPAHDGLGTTVVRVLFLAHPNFYLGPQHLINKMLPPFPPNLPSEATPVAWQMSSLTAL